MRRNFGGGCKVSYEEFLKIKENIDNQPIPDRLVKVVEYATRKILYDDEKNNDEIVVANIGCLELLLNKKSKFSKLKSFLKKKKNKDLEINL